MSRTWFAHVSLYIGDALFWIEDSEGDVCPVKFPDFIYNPQSNARVVSSRGMIEKGWDIDFYGDELATYTDADIDLSYRFNIHDINGLSQMIVSDIPDGPDYDKGRGRFLLLKLEEICCLHFCCYDFCCFYQATKKRKNDILLLGATKTLPATCFLLLPRG